MNSLRTPARRGLGVGLALGALQLGALQLAACASAPPKTAAVSAAPAPPAVVTMAPIPNPPEPVHERRPPAHAPPSAAETRREHGGEHAKAAAPAAPPLAAPPAAAPPARDPARAARLRGRGLEELDRGAVTRAVALLTQASQLDPDSALIRHDLERAGRIARAVHADK